MNIRGYRVVRFLAGLLLVTVGADKFFGFYPLPTGTEPADAFVAALEATGYMMPFVAAVETAAGLLFLSNRYVALAAVIVMPVSLNAFFFHLFLSPAAMFPTTALLLLNLLIIYEKRECYRALFKAR